MWHDNSKRERETQADGKTGREKQRQRRWEKARGGRARSRTSQQEGEMVSIEMAAQLSQLDTNITGVVKHSKDLNEATSLVFKTFSRG